jgi:vacuolar protein sorting-associated protein 13D
MIPTGNFNKFAKFAKFVKMPRVQRVKNIELRADILKLSLYQFYSDDGSPVHQSWMGYDRDIETRELVLDVPNGNMVILKRKEQDKRSQLWRMTSQGMLQHEGSSTPRDPRRPSMTQTNVFVLDIEDIALQPGRNVKLMLRKPDERRTSTQTWRFTEVGLH